MGKVITRTVDIDDDEAIADLAKEIGIKPEQVKQTIRLSQMVQAHVEEEELSMNQTIAGLMSVVSDILRNYVPEVQRAEIATDIYRNLWVTSGLSSDVQMDSSSWMPDDSTKEVKAH